MLTYESIADLVAAAEEAQRPLSALVLADQAQQMGEGKDSLFRRMEASLLVMREACRLGADKDLRSASGMTGGNAFKLRESTHQGGLTGPFLTKALERALAVSEYNASMGCIVAAPTAGSCGILPAAVLTVAEEKGLPDEAAVMALFTAGAYGMVIAQRATVAGAEGGCQAECGSAAAMAAAAVVELAGGSPAMGAHAAAMALKNQLGLVCDPVAGLVEVPCVKRNAGGVALALTAAELALAGIESVIPVDEVIDAMRAVGEALPATLRETAAGGLAVTPAALRLRKQIFGEG